MKWAILSDIHANLVALEAILRHVDSQSVDGIIYTGDLVVYGPSPNECVAALYARQGRDHWRTRCMMGNNDLMVVNRSDNDALSTAVRESLAWTIKTITPENLHRLAGLSREPLHIEDGLQLTVMHGTLTDPLGEFTYMDRDDFTIKESLRELKTPIGIFGHTHRPAIYKAVPKPSPHIFLLERDYPKYEKQDGIGLYEVSYADDLASDKKLLINAGSIGQPRDGDPRAAYLLLDEEAHMLHFYRIPYDITTVQEKMHAIDAPEKFIERLERGV